MGSSVDRDTQAFAVKVVTFFVQPVPFSQKLDSSGRCSMVCAEIRMGCLAARAPVNALARSVK